MNAGALALSIFAAHTMLRRIVDLPTLDRSSAHARLLTRLQVVFSRRGVCLFLLFLICTSSIVAFALMWNEADPHGSYRTSFVLIAALSIGAIEGLVALLVHELRAPSSTVDESAAPIELRSPHAVNRLGSLVGYGAFLLMIVWFARGTTLDGWSPSAGTFATAAFLVLWTSMSLVLWTPRVDVGTDGLYIRGLRQRFIAFTGREILIERPWSLQIRCDGKRVSRLWYLSARDQRRRSCIVAQIRNRFDGYKMYAGDLPSSGALALARGEPPAANYRTGSPSRDELWRIVASPRIAARVRIDARTALGGEPQQDDEARFRQIGATVVNPELRAALFRKRP